MLGQGLLIILIATVGQADFEGSTRAQCTTKELHKKTPSLARVIEDTDQGYCVPHAVAYMLEHETGQRVSVNELGFNVNYHYMTEAPGKNPFQSLQPGEVFPLTENPTKEFFPAGILRFEETLDYINRKGFCSESKVASSYTSATYPHNILEAYVESSRQSQVRQALFPGGTNAGPIRYSHLWNDIRKVMTKSCEPRKTLDSPKWFKLRHSSQVKGRALFESLDHDKPSALTMTMSKLYGQPNWLGAHTAVLVGRRWNNKTNECDYMIRDTGGPHCKNFLGTKIESSLRCEDGLVVVGEQRLSELTHETVELVPKPAPPKYKTAEVQEVGVTTTSGQR